MAFGLEVKKTQVGTQNTVIRQKKKNIMIMVEYQSRYRESKDHALHSLSVFL